MKDFRFRQPVVSQPRHPPPRGAILLAAPPKAASPYRHHVIAEGTQRRAVGRHGVIGEESTDNLPQPSPLFGDRLMHSPSQLLRDLSKLRAHAVPPGLPLELEMPLAGFAADEREAQEVEGLRFSKPALSARDRCETAKLDQAGLHRMQRQSERCQARAHRVPEAPGVSFVLEADDDVIRIPQDDHVARGLAPSPALGPEVKHVMQVDEPRRRTWWCSPASARRASLSPRICRASGWSSRARPPACAAAARGCASWARTSPRRWR